MSLPLRTLLPRRLAQRAVSNARLRHVPFSAPCRSLFTKSWTPSGAAKAGVSPTPSTSRTFASSAGRRARYSHFDDPEGSKSQNRWDWRTWDTTTRVVAGGVCLGGVYYVIHLERVPETGRWRFMDMNPKHEAMLAERAHQVLIQEYGGKIIAPAHPLARHIRRVVVQILDANSLGVLKSDEHGRHVGAPAPSISSMGGDGGDENWDPDAAAASRRTAEVATGENVNSMREWNLIVVNDDKEVNAMATYGNIVVFTGILPICKDDDGLAAVLGHEIGHVVARHASEHYSSIKPILLIATLLQILSVDFGVAQLVTTLLLELPNSRTQEFEADRIGLRLSSRACFDPKSAAEIQARLAQMEKKQGRWKVDFIYAHPASEERVKRLTELLPEAAAIQAANPACAHVGEQFDAFRGQMGFASRRPLWG